MKGLNRLVVLMFAITTSTAAGCGGASEAGPRIKPGPSDRNFRVPPESASNTSTVGHTDIPLRR